MKRKNRHPVITLRGGQFKSLTAAREVAQAVGVIERAWGIRCVRLALENTFVCPDIDLDRLCDTPDELWLRSAIKDPS